MFGLGAGELLLICGVAVLFFGPKKIPELAKGIGEGIKEFRKSTTAASDVVEIQTTNDKKES